MMIVINHTWEELEKIPDLPKNDIHIWQIVLPDFIGYEKKFRDLLNATERQKLNQFKYEDLKNNFLVSRGSLRYLLSKFVGENPADIKIKTTSDGKPVLAEDHHGEIAFNISHAGEVCLIALSRTHEVGVDVERIEPLPNIKNMVASFLTASEIKSIDGLLPDEQISRFFSLWTAKEALLKAVGCGLMVHPSQVDVEEVRLKKRLTIQDRSNMIELPKITLRELSVRDGYAAWMAYVGEGARIGSFRLTQNLVRL